MIAMMDTNVLAIITVLLLIIAYYRGKKIGATKTAERFEKVPAWTDVLPKGKKCTWVGGPFEISNITLGVVNYEKYWYGPIVLVRVDNRVIKAGLTACDEFIITGDYEINKIIKAPAKNPSD